MEKSKATATASFIFGLAFWIPLLNLIFGVIAIITGFKALYNIKKHPEAYSGKWIAISGIALGAVVYVIYIAGLGVCFSGYKEVCKAMGLTFLS